MSAEPNSVVVEPLDVDARLRSLGLVSSELTDSLVAGASAMALTYRTNHPPGYGGISFWAEAVKTLRDTKEAQGWEKSDARNYSTVVSPDKALQIAIARGDEWTGRTVGVPFGKPSTQHPKGAATQLAVERNQQLSLFDDIPMPAETPDVPGVVTWVLLHYLKNHKIRAELSRPTKINASGFVEEWAERIILGEVNLDPTKFTLPDEPPVEPDVLVRRRA